jgi:signal transduction histidine kinase
MQPHPLLGAILGQLEALERSSRESRLPLLTGQIEALRQSILAMASKRASLEQDMEAAALKAQGHAAQVMALKKAMAENKRRYEEVLRSFDRFRQGFGFVESLRDLRELPDILDKLTELFKVGLIRLILDEQYGSLAPKGFPLMPQDRLREISQVLRDGGKSSHVGPASHVPPELFGPGAGRHEGSCFAYPLEDRFRPGLLVGIILMADARPKRYQPEMATDFMEHFCDAIGHEVLDVADRCKAEELREHVERITRHDLKSPLSAILSLPQFLMEAPNLDGDQKDMVRMIMDAGRRMQGMINLSFSLYRMEQGQYELMPESLDAKRLIQTVWQDVGSPYRAANYGFRLDCPDEPLTVPGEELLCYTMLANLIKNALEASSSGDTVSVSLSREPGQLVIAVHNAQDVPTELRENFFDKYATAGKHGGTGLGTYSARLIAETHGGSVELDTGNGQGTWVRVRLPDGDQGVTASGT